MRLVIARQILNSKANFAEVLLDAVYPVLVLVKVDEKIQFIIRQQKLYLGKIIANLLIVKELEVFQNIQKVQRRPLIQLIPINLIEFFLKSLG